MKVLLINGSPHENGCTDAALKVLSEEFFKQGIGTDMMHIGRTVCGCMACGQCADIGKCIMEDRVNDALAKARHADGFVFGSPVYYASPCLLYTSGGRSSGRGNLSQRGAASDETVKLRRNSLCGDDTHYQG